MKRASWLVFLQLATLAYARIDFENAFILSNQDFQFEGKDGAEFTVPLEPGAEYLLYASSGNPLPVNRYTMIQALMDQALHQNTLEMLITPDDDNRLKPFYISSDYSALRFIVPRPFEHTVVFYVVKHVDNPPPVYDGGWAWTSVFVNVSSTLPSATILSSADWFNLQLFELEGADSVEVYPAGWREVMNRENEMIERVFTTRDKESALRTSVTIMGPIATVFYPNLKTRNYSCQITDVKYTYFDRDNIDTSIVVSPGFISFLRNDTYERDPITILDFHHRWSFLDYAHKGEKVAASIAVNISFGSKIWNDVELNITTGSGHDTSTTIYSETGNSSRDVNASWIDMTYKGQQPLSNPLFIVQILTKNAVEQLLTSDAATATSTLTPKTSLSSTSATDTLMTTTTSHSNHPAFHALLVAIVALLHILT